MSAGVGGAAAEGDQESMPRGSGVDAGRQESMPRRISMRYLEKPAFS